MNGIRPSIYPSNRYDEVMSDLLGFHTANVWCHESSPTAFTGVSILFTGKGQRAGTVGGKPTGEGKRDAFLSCVFCYLLLLPCVRACLCASARVCVPGVFWAARKGLARSVELRWQGFFLSLEIYAPPAHAVFAYEFSVPLQNVAAASGSEWATETLPITVTVAHAIYQRWEPFSLFMLHAWALRDALVVIDLVRDPNQLRRVAVGGDLIRGGGR
ncbi:hypothetical protein LX36DRAFT_369314 [Colletotrichum falcatum]|nr:hypothetical protein LX36DRAFT_369314 [Colletotrichum falcatum]